MNITFLIGNGFDINLGLNTLYSSFLAKYSEVSEEDAKVIKQFKKDILEDTEHWSSAELAFGKYTRKFDKTNGTAEDFCDCHEHFCVELAQYLQREEKRIDVKTLDNLMLENFAKALIRFGDGFRATQRDQIMNAINLYDGGYVFNFLVFNYTNTLSSLVTEIKRAKKLGTRTYRNTTYTNSIGTVIHVHGSTEMDMVLGVNDETQIENLELFSDADQYYISQIIKRKTNAINEENTDERASQLLNTSNFIYIYGMSIGETDAIWWERICNILKEKPNLHVVIYAHNAPDDTLIRTKYLQFERTKRESVLKYSPLSDEEKEKIINRIHITKSNIFDGIKNIAQPTEDETIERLKQDYEQVYKETEERKIQEQFQRAYAEATAQANH